MIPALASAISAPWRCSDSNSVWLSSFNGTSAVFNAALSGLSYSIPPTPESRRASSLAPRVRNPVNSSSGNRTATQMKLKKS